ncbi:hypothetical protein K438DRAFT_1972624 [Mycena galopus ATCC 62051]|nr:hypothetical protein K438DRAFT_1972624 [Mycena galopus ATCC 62051]
MPKPSAQARPRHRPPNAATRELRRRLSLVTARHDLDAVGTVTSVTLTPGQTAFRSFATFLQKHTLCTNHFFLPKLRYLPPPQYAHEMDFHGLSFHTPPKGRSSFYTSSSGIVRTRTRTVSLFQAATRPQNASDDLLQRRHPFPCRASLARLITPPRTRHALRLPAPLVAPLCSMTTAREIRAAKASGAHPTPSLHHQPHAQHATLSFFAAGATSITAPHGRYRQRLLVHECDIDHRQRTEHRGQPLPISRTALITSLPSASHHSARRKLWAIPQVLRGAPAESAASAAGISDPLHQLHRLSAPTPISARKLDLPSTTNSTREIAPPMHLDCHGVSSPWHQG